ARELRENAAIGQVDFQRRLRNKAQCRAGLARLASDHDLLVWRSYAAPGCGGRRRRLNERAIAQVDTHFAHEIGRDDQRVIVGVPWFKRGAAVELDVVAEAPISAVSGTTR